jgi:predicted short-subunit dehydrogenase-like oxidoreductase (DUF2520 family)
VKQYRVSFIGAGRVGSALCRRFFDAGIKIGLIVSRTEAAGKRLAEECKAHWNSSPVFSGDDDCIIVAVPDDSVGKVIAVIETGQDTVIAHTAGSLGLEVFPGNLKHKGVFYPLQTFSPERSIEFKGLPFFIEASDNSTSDLLADLAGLTGGTVNIINENQRKLLHVAAVFVNNFSNYMLSAGKSVTDRAGLSFSLLEPLIRETIDKAIITGPVNSQTGPASRDDLGTIRKHINLLSFDPQLQKLYKEVTKAILNQHKDPVHDQF